MKKFTMVVMFRALGAAEALYLVGEERMDAEGFWYLDVSAGQTALWSRRKPERLS